MTKITHTAETRPPRLIPDGVRVGPAATGRAAERHTVSRKQA